MVLAMCDHIPDMLLHSVLLWIAAVLFGPCIPRGCHYSDTTERASGLVDCLLPVPAARHDTCIATRAGLGNARATRGAAGRLRKWHCHNSETDLRAGAATYRRKGKERWHDDRTDIS